jgi:hypothetical protein
MHVAALTSISRRPWVEDVYFALADRESDAVHDAH